MIVRTSLVGVRVRTAARMVLTGLGILTLTLTLTITLVGAWIRTAAKMAVIITL
jgi:hypothetical protein